MNKLLSLFVMLVVLAGCGQQASHLKSTIIYTDGGKTYFVTEDKANAQLHFYQCPELTVAKTVQEAKTKCINGNQPIVKSKNEVREQLVTQMLTPDSGLQKKIAAYQVRKMFDTYRQEMQESAAKKKETLAQEVRELSGRIAGTERLLTRYKNRKQKIEDFAREAGGEKYLDSKYRWELRDLNKKIPKWQKILDGHQEKHQADTKILKERDFMRHLTYKYVDIRLAEFSSEPLNSLSPKVFRVWPYLIEYVFTGDK